MVRILVVDDERDTLLTLRDRIERSKEPLKFICFGVDENPLSLEKDEFEEEIAEAFIHYVKEGKAKNFDILLMDFSIPKKNADVILKEIRNEQIPPVIMMSADAHAIHNSILELLKNDDAKRYLYKNSDFFPSELNIYAHSVTEEYYNHQMITLLEELNQEEFSTFKTFAQKLSSTFMAQLPDTYVVVREYDAKKKTLIQSNEVEGVSFQRVINRESDQRLFDVLDSIEGYKIDNNFSIKGYLELRESFGDTIKSLIIRIGKRYIPQGIVVVFKKNTHFSFENFLVKSIKISIDSLNANMIKQTVSFNRMLRFVPDIMNESNEEKILKNYTKMVHELYNQNHTKNKTTLKILKPGKDILELLCEGDCAIDRDDFAPNLKDHSISSTAVNENISILTYDSRDMDEVWNRFKDVYQKLYGFEIEESKKIKFHQTAKDKLTQENLEMRSGLCIPISSFSRDKGGATFGVINLESEQENYYTIKQMKILFNMSLVVGGRLESLRNQKLLDGLFESSRTINYKEQVHIIERVLQEYLGFFSLNIFKKVDGGQLKLENVIIEDNKVNIAEVKKKYNEVLMDKDEFQKTALYQAAEYFNHGYSIFYIPELHEAPIYIVGKFKEDILEFETKNSYDKELKVYHQNFYDIKSYYAQAIRYNGKLMGILVLGFQIANPMINYNLELIEKVTDLLGVIYLSQDKKIQDEIKDNYIQSYIRNFKSNFRHIVSNHFNDVKQFLDKEKTPEILHAFREISNITEHYDNTLENDSYKAIVNILIDEFLRNGISGIEIQIQIEDFRVFENKKEFLYILFFHLFSNAKVILEHVVKPLVRIESYISNDLLYIKVYDNGGIPNNPEKIFEDNYSEQHNKGGFGLFYIRTRVEEKDGEIKFLTAPSKHFRITIPLDKIGERNAE